MIEKTNNLTQVWKIKLKKYFRKQNQKTRR